ncbi:MULTISPECIES: HAMP domain-containing sensor histidine kinase [Pontibacillus]|uniref:histidine kinase n=1 Tax=Pontibacillus chungwhensis TaxID=265426 RepID=A0ABY8UT60_9BACI|nr:MULTISPECIES: HAMP domain-containing sensor histidine kinase [Pontibacillus]MCD5323313.1 HAMP domain-containing histidine kinase [Pontibacillus sp. HN14]WIF96694.1 HAMP domain-containing sensor histidine kinase [Pontibacillus chungwhensis]
MLLVLRLDEESHANYYEKQIPEVTSFIKTAKSELVDHPSVSRERLNEKVPLDGMTYHVYDKDGSLLYGSTEARGMELPIIEKVNTTDFENDSYQKYLPILSSSEELVGMVKLTYQLESGTPIQRLSLLIILAPFLFIVFYTYVCGGKLSRRLFTPIRELAGAIDSIKEQDLDFTLHAANRSDELGDLARAFETMKQELHTSLEKQWKLEQERQDFLSAVTHDLKTPLTIMKSNAQVLDRKIDDNERVYSAAILKQIDRVTNLVHEVGEVQRINGGSFPIQLQKVEPKSFFEKELQSFRTYIEAKGDHYSIQLSDERSVHKDISIDPDRMRQVIENIISNSVRYTPSSSTIHAHLDLTDGAVELTISDNGPGFHSAELPQVFDQFYRGNPSTSGQGLGLSIVKNIIEAHRGEVNVWNDGGASISITLFG